MKSCKSNIKNRKLNRVNHSLLVILLLFIFSGSKNLLALNDSVIVDLGSKKITLEEFVKRFELTPWPRREIKSFSEDQKLEFLYSLIAEKLFSIEAENNSLDTSYNLQTANKLIEKMFVRDALYKKEIKNKVKISKEEENDAFAKAQIKLFVKYIYSQDSAHIYGIYSSLINGASFDSILSERPEFEGQNESIEISYGSLPVKIEETLYRTAVKNFTLPMPADYGYYIFRVDSTIIQIVIGDKKSSDVYRKSLKILRDRKEEELFQKYFKSFFAKKRAEASAEIFLILADELYKTFKSKLLTINTSNKIGKLNLEPSDVDRIESNLGAQINEPFIFIDTDKFSVKEFLTALLFHGFTVQDTSIEYLKRRLNSRIKTFIEDEFLANEGKRQNLDKLSEVKEDLAMWKDFYRNISLNSELKKEIKIDDEEVESHFKSHSSEAQTMVQVNILEILVDSLEHIEMLLKRISEGENFSELARKYSKRKWAAERGGEFGFFPTSMYGEIGEVASKMEIGEIYAPLKTNDGYSIIKLIDKKIDSVSNIINYDEVKEKIRTNIFNKKFFEKKNKFVAQLAEKYIKKIDYDLLNSIKTTSLNMFAYRFMGFGGRITAVPLLSRYTEWYDEWMKLKQQVP